MPKKSHSTTRKFKGKNGKQYAPATTTQQQNPEAPVASSTAAIPTKAGAIPNTNASLQIVSYISFLFNYIHFTAEERSNKGENVLEEGALKFHTDNQEEFYGLLVKLARDVNILSKNSNVDSEFSSQRLDSLFNKIFSVFTATSAPAQTPKQEKKKLNQMRNFVAMLQKDTVHEMVRFLVNYKFNQCDGINLTVLRMHELLINLGRFAPQWNVQMVESGLISGWLVRILEQDSNSREAIEVYRLFALQWLTVIVGEYHLFRRRARERALHERQQKIEKKRAEIKKRRKLREEEEEKRLKEIEEMRLREQEEQEEELKETPLDDDDHEIEQIDSTNEQPAVSKTNAKKKKKKRRTYDDDHLFEDNDEDDQLEAELEELERLEKEESDGSDDPNVIKLRKELFDADFVKVAVGLLKSVAKYDDEDTFVIITANGEETPKQKRLNHQEHVDKCQKTLFQQLMNTLTELLTSTHAFDESVFNDLVKSMIDQNVQSVFQYTFSHMQNINCLRRSFNLLYFMLHCEEEDVREALLEQPLPRIVEIFLSTVEEGKGGKISFKNGNLAVACLYNLSYICASSPRVAKQLLNEQPDLFEIMVTLFKERPFKEDILMIVYGTFSSLMRVAPVDAVLELEERWQITDDLINDVLTKDSRLRFPGIVSIRILLERLQEVSNERRAPIYQKLLASGVSNVMLQTIFEKKFQQENEKQEEKARRNPQYDAQRILHQRYMHPGSLCTLNVLLDQSANSGNPQVNQSLGQLLSSDERYAEIIQFMRFIQQAHDKRFSYRYVFMLIGLIIFVVLLFPLVAKMFGLSGATVPPPMQ